MEKARILIVEDEAIVAEDLNNALNDIGYEVVGIVVSADDAIKQATQLKPDLILMDIILRGDKNGIDASSRIKGEMDIPIIFLTAFSDYGLINKAKNTEPYAYIIKPFQERQLLASIEMALYKNRTEKRLKESEERMRQINDELEERVRERTAELKHTYEQLNAATQQMYHAQKMESVGLLAGGIAHDFNNLMTVVLGNISLAKMYMDPENEQFNILSKAEKASLRAKDLTRQLLTFSRGGEPIKRIIPVAKLIEDSVFFSRRGSNVTCNFEIQDYHQNIEADEGQITQVISNIIINADQAMPEGGVISVRCESVTISGSITEQPFIETGDYVKISIQDHGTGIPKKHISQIFDPFFTTKDKGSGLGLATVYSIIKKHGGQITVESEVGMGSSFHIYLPVAKEKVSLESVVDVMEKPSTSQGEKILVMDDDENIRELLGITLTNLGYRIDFAGDGAEAIELYRNRRDSGDSFDAVIIDLTIPGGIGGKETIKELIKLDPDVRGIVSSGYSNDAIMANYRKYGFSGVLSKPYQIDDLVGAVQDVLHM